MKTFISKSWRLGLTFAAVAAIAGCSDSSSSDDAAVSDGAVSDGNTSDASLPFALSAGMSCFDVVSVAQGSADGCDLGVADTVANMGLVGASLPFTYTPSATAASTISVGTEGSLGGGPIAFNMADLLRDGDTADGTCTWHEHVNSTVTVTAINEFNIAVTRTQSMFATACTGLPPLTAGMCTSTWTWHMKKSATKTPPCN